jgi:monoamine oxidase
VAALAAPLVASVTKKAGGGCEEQAPRVLFAGEACHVKYIGTTAGAYLTGQQAAEQLLAALGARDAEKEPAVLSEV